MLGVSEPRAPAPAGWAGRQLRRDAVLIMAERKSGTARDAGKRLLPGRASWRRSAWDAGRRGVRSTTGGCRTCRTGDAACRQF